MTGAPSVGLTGIAQLQYLEQQVQAGQMSQAEYQDVLQAYANAGTAAGSEHFIWSGPGSVSEVPGAPPAPAGAGGGTGTTLDPTQQAQQAQQAQDQAAALGILENELTSWGFGSDAIGWAQGEISSNKSVDQILFDLRQQSFYKNSIFGQTNALRQKNGLPVMTEQQILDYKTYAAGLAQQAGLPHGFITDKEVATLAGSDVSQAELDARVTQGYVAAMKASPDVLAELNTYYGITTGHLAAYYLDPTRALPLLQQQFQSAQIGAAAGRTGWGMLDQTTAMELAKLGTTDAQAQTGFTDLAKQAQLFQALPGEHEKPIPRIEQIGAEFEGNAQDQQAIARRTAQRKAEFAGGYRFAETAGRGITGLGSAPRNG